VDKLSPGPAFFRLLEDPHMFTKQCLGVERRIVTGRTPQGRKAGHHLPDPSLHEPLGFDLPSSLRSARSGR
jgi:hypothetical protein